MIELLHAVGKYALLKGEAWRIGEGAEIMDAYAAIQDRATPPGAFTVKHYAGSERPDLRGLGFDISVAEDRETVEEFAQALNVLVARAGRST